MDNINAVWEQELPSVFADTVCSISNPGLMRAFLRDVMTEKEIIEVSARLRAAEMLMQGRTYKDIVAETKLSSRTVARISDWMQNGAGGYGAVLAGVHAHTRPVDAG